MSKSIRSLKFDKGPHGRAPLLTLALVLLMLGVLPPMGSATGDTQGEVDVLFYFHEEEYIWGKARTSQPMAITEASMAAANGASIGFSYVPGSPPVVTIKGLSPAPFDSWSWTLQRWNSASERWEPMTADGSVSPGQALAWCPSHRLPIAPDPLSKYPWQMFRGSASRQGASQSPPPLYNLTCWTCSTGQAILSSPCVADGRVFVGVPSTGLLCLRASDGALLWQAPLGTGGDIRSSPAFWNGSVIIGAPDGKLRALDSRTGSLKWSYDAGSGGAISSSPVAYRGRVLFSDEAGFLHCLDENGGLLWKANLSGPAILTSPAIWEDRVLAGDDAGALHCFNLSDGALIWNRTLGGRIEATPAISPGGYAFVSTLIVEGGTQVRLNLYSIYMKDSVMQWNASYSPSISSPACAAGGLYLGTATEFVGHHPDRGTRMWGLPLAPVDSSPASCGGYVCFATGASPGKVACAKVGGALDWTFGGNYSFFSSPAISDGRLFACDLNGDITCLGREPRENVSAVVLPTNRTYIKKLTPVAVILNNTGEKAAVVTFYLTVNGNLTDTLKGPYEVRAGESKTVGFDWKPVAKGTYTLGLEVAGTNATVTPGTMTVTDRPPSDGCVIVAPAISLVVLGLVVPLLVRSRRRLAK